MNELIKINNENSDRPTVMGRELHEALGKWESIIKKVKNGEKTISEIICCCDSFEKLFIAVSELRINSDEDMLKSLIEELQCPYINFKFGSEVVVLLKDSVEVELAFCKIKKPRQSKEKEMQKEIILHFHEYFPEYVFVESEKKVFDGGRIDIYAITDEMKPVLIEVKTGSGLPNRQLHDYALHFSNPILIGISEEEIPLPKRANDIIYRTIGELRKNKNE